MSDLRRGAVGCVVAGSDFDLSGDASAQAR